MRTSQILQQNLNNLMQAHISLSTNLKIVAASDGKLSNGTLGRVRLGGKTDIETVGVIADTFGLAPWQLLVEGLNPKSPPSLADNSVIDQIKNILATNSKVLMDKTKGLRGSMGDSEHTQLLRESKQNAFADLEEFLETPKGTTNASSKFGRVPKPTN